MKILELYEGLDVSELLNIRHYEKPVPGAQTRGMIRGGFPGYVPRTDEPRIQSNIGVLGELKGKSCVATVKINGTSASFIYRDGDYQVCSRNNSFKLDDPANDGVVYVKISKKYSLDQKLKALSEIKRGPHEGLPESFGKNFAIQGEIAGPDIQKNQLGLKEIDLFVFNIYDIDNGRYLNVYDTRDICGLLDLKMVPIDEFFTFNHTLEDLLKLAEGKYPGTNNLREGLVIRPCQEMFSETLRGRMSFKVLNNSFLEREKE